MVVTMQQVYNGVSNYYEREIAAKATGLNKFMAYFMLPSIPNKINDMIKEYHSYLECYFDENGNIKLDELYQASKQAMNKTLQIEWNGIIFKENDIDLLYRLIRE